MPKAEKTGEIIIQRSAQVFHIKGYKNTALTDIQEVSKLTKGPIYGNFSERNESAVGVFQGNFSIVFNRINKCINDASTLYGHKIIR